MVVNNVLTWAREADLTVLEQYPRHAKGSAVHVLAGLFHVITYQLWKYELPWVDVHINTLKAFATGDARAPKVAMLAAAKPYLDAYLYPRMDHNVADAVHLARYGEQHYGDLVVEE